MIFGINRKNRDTSPFLKIHFFKKRGCVPVFSKVGFSLVEVMLAVAILGIGLCGVLRAYAGATGILEVGQYYVEAMNVAKIKMSDLQQKVLEDGKLTGFSRGTLNGFKWNWMQQPFMKEGFEGMYEVVLTVSHSDISRTVSLSTYYEEKQDEEE